MKALYKHKARIYNSKVYLKNKYLWDKEKQNKEGKDIFITIEIDYGNKPHDNINGYYFAVIIGKSCMQSNDFAGWDKEEIHEYLLKRLSRIPKTFKKNKKTIFVTKRYSSMNMKEKVKYLENVRIYLSQEHGIITDEPENYKIKEYEVNRSSKEFNSTQKEA